MMNQHLAHFQSLNGNWNLSIVLHTFSNPLNKCHKLSFSILFSIDFVFIALFKGKQIENVSLPQIIWIDQFIGCA